MNTASGQAKERVEAAKAVLLKYAISRPVETQDETILRRYEKIGIVHFAFCFGQCGSFPRKTWVRLTEKGKGLLGLTG